MIQQRDLSIISNALLKERGGRRVPDQAIELDYALGWFLSELAQHPFNENLAFKGGTALMPSISRKDAVSRCIPSTRLPPKRSLH